MKQKLLKCLYGINISFLFVAYLYYFLHYLSYFFLIIPGLSDSDFTYKFLKLLNFGMYDEAAAWLPIFVMGIIILIALSCAVFFRKAISHKTYMLLTLSFVPMLIINIPTFLAVFIGGSSLNISLVWWIISFILIILYIVFTMIFALRDFKCFNGVQSID